MLWFFGLLTTCILAVAAILTGIAGGSDIFSNERDDYGARGIFGLGLALCSAVLTAGAIAGLIALRSG